MPRLPNGQFTSKNPVKAAKQVNKNKGSVAKSLYNKGKKQVGLK